MKLEFARCGSCYRKGAYRRWLRFSSMHGWDVRCRYCGAAEFFWERTERTLEQLAILLHPATATREIP